MMTGLVEPLCRPVGLEGSVALATREGRSILKQRSFDSATESSRPRKMVAGECVVGIIR